MAKPGEHTYAPITCARTKPVCPADSTAPLHCCVHCVCNSSSVSSLSLSLSQCVSALSTWHLACWHFYWLWHLLVLPANCPLSCLPLHLSVGIPSCRCFFAAWKLIKNVCTVPCWGPFPARVHSVPVCCLSVRLSVCVCVVGHVAILRIRQVVLIEHEHTQAQHT